MYYILQYDMLQSLGDRYIIGDILFGYIELHC